MNPRPADSLLISEIFGPTVQGEGPATGRRAVFIRTAGCPVGCSWCDTKYSWDPAARQGTTHSVTRMTVGEVAHQAISRLGTSSGIVVVTGGEPLAQASEVMSLATDPALIRHSLHLETSGVHLPSEALGERFDVIVVSPKLANSGVAKAARINPTALREFDRQGAWFKFVVKDSTDLEEIAELEENLGLRQIMVMPEGRDPETLVARASVISDEVVKRGWSITTRLHILLWGDSPGR